jgi:hypothetical protein
MKWVENYLQSDIILIIKLNITEKGEGNESIRQAERNRCVHHIEGHA